MKPHTITAPLEMDKDGTWYYVHVPLEVRQDFKSLEKRGIIPVTARVGSSTWPASLLPWADGSAQLSIGRKIRERENLSRGQQIEVEIAPRERA